MGDLLNEYLRVGHNTDGTHKTNAVPDATAATAGKIKLTGDLGGTASSPTVPGLASAVHLTGDETIAGHKTFSGTITVPAPVNATDAATKTYVDSAPQIKRVQAFSDTDTLIPDCDTYDCGYAAELSQDSAIASPTGTPNDFQQYVLRITTTTSRALSWGADYRGSTTTLLPNYSTGGGKTDYLGFQWNEHSSKWDLIAINQNF